MSEKNWSLLTSDPILLAALTAPETAAAQAAARPRSSSRYRGVTRNKNANSTTWSASVGVGGKEYALGTYPSEEEAALARNYGEELLKHPNPGRNVIPADSLPDEAARQRVAATVVTLLRKKGALPPTADRANSQDTGAPAITNRQPENL